MIFYHTNRKVIKTPMSLLSEPRRWEENCHPRERRGRAGWASERVPLAHDLDFSHVYGLLVWQMFKTSSIVFLVMHERCFCLYRDIEKYFLSLKASMNVQFLPVNTMRPSIAPPGPCRLPHPIPVIQFCWTPNRKISKLPFSTFPHILPLFLCPHFLQCIHLSLLLHCETFTISSAEASSFIQQTCHRINKASDLSQTRFLPPRFIKCAPSLL